MELDEFEILVREVRVERSSRSYPEGFNPFDLVRVSELELEQIEDALDICLPVNYKQFMLRFRGGMFMFLDLLPIFSPGGRSEDLLSVNRGRFREYGFLAVAPVGTGDWWGFSLSGKQCGETVDFWFHDENRIEESGLDFLDFLVRRGLKSG